jgi:hypothetical protein
MFLKYAAFLTIGIFTTRCVTAQGAQAQPRAEQPATVLSGPTLGCLLRTSPVDLRLIWGVPGATYVGAPQAGMAASNAILSSAHDWVLIDNGGSVSASLLSDCAAARSTDLQISGGIDIGGSSPSGAIAAVYSRSANALSVIAGLPDIPAAAVVYSATELPDSISALAVSDASLVAVSTTSGVYVLHSGSAPALVYSSTDIPSLAFIRGSTDLAIADRAGRQVVLLRDVAGAASLQVIAPTGDDDASRPAMVVSPGAGLLVALAGAELIFADTMRSSTARVTIMAGADCITTLPSPGVVMVMATGRPAQLVNFNESNPRAYVMAVPEQQRQ